MDESFIEHGGGSSNLEYIRVSSGYQGADTTRWMIMPKGEMILVADQIEDTTSHTYTFQLHGNDGDGGTFTDQLAAENKATWSRNGVSMESHIVAQGTPSYSTRTDIHEEGYKNPGTHTVAEVAVTGTAAAFAGVLQLHQGGTPASTSTVSGAMKDAIVLSGTMNKSLFVSQEEQVGALFETAETGLMNGVESDGVVQFIEENSSGEWSMVFVGDGSYAKYGTETIVTTDIATSFSVEKTGNQYSGYAEAGTLSFPLLGTPSNIVVENGTSSWNGTELAITVSSPGVFSFDLAPWQDTDLDGVYDHNDICAGHDDFVDQDGDGTPDGCEGDADGDGVIDDNDICAGHDDSLDQDGDGTPDGCEGDADGDGVIDDNDICAGHDDSLDQDGDGTPDGCEILPPVTVPPVVQPAALTVGPIITSIAPITEIKSGEKPQIHNPNSSTYAPKLGQNYQHGANMDKFLNCVSYAEKATYKAPRQNDESFDEYVRRIKEPLITGKMMFSFFSDDRAPRFDGICMPKESIYSSPKTDENSNETQANGGKWRASRGTKNEYVRFHQWYLEKRKRQEGAFLFGPRIYTTHTEVLTVEAAMEQYPEAIPQSIKQRFKLEEKQEN